MTARFFAIFGFMAALCAAQTGEITGKVSLRGIPPPEKMVDLSAFPDVSRAYPHLVGKLTTRHYLVAADGGLANVFVYVTNGLEGRTFSVPTNQPVLNQTNAGFYPYMLGVVTNQTFLIRNSEPYMDTIHALPRVNKEFNIAQPFTAMVHRQRFERPEVLIRIKCEVHPWEFAFIGVAPHPFFAVTETNGTYRIPGGLPAGHYVIEAVHPKAGRLTREVWVRDAVVTNVDFAFEMDTAAK